MRKEIIQEHVINNILEIKRVLDVDFDENREKSNQINLNRYKDIATQNIIS